MNNMKKIRKRNTPLVKNIPECLQSSNKFTASKTASDKKSWLNLKEKKSNEDISRFLFLGASNGKESKI